MRQSVIVAAACVMLAACATLYQTPYQKRGLTGGYTETQLDQNVYLVDFAFNLYLSADQAIEFNLLRCAELTLQNGFGYFAIVDAKKGASYSTTTIHSGSTIVMAKPSWTNTIVMLKDRNDVSGETYDAKVLYDSLSAKYEIGKK